MLEPIEHTLQLSSSREKVWEALATAQGIAAWFSDEVELDSKEGATGWFIWKQHGHFAVRLEELVPGERVVWRWARDPEKSLENTESTRVVWDLGSLEGGGSTLHMRESGFTSEEAREENVGGWIHELGHLREYLAPYPGGS